MSATAAKGGIIIAATHDPLGLGNENLSPFCNALRDVKLAARSGGSAALALSFFALVATLMPLGIGADLRLLARVAAGVLWVGAVLAALLSLDRLFQGDYEDGSRSHRARTLPLRTH